jgi:hypothetical protein
MNYFFITLGVLFIIYIFVSIKRNEFTIEESAFWIVGSIVVLFLSIFYKSLDKLSSKLGIAYGSSFIFLIAIIVLLIMNFRNSKKILKMNEQIIKLSHKVSILESEIDERNNYGKEKESKEKDKTNRK